MEKAPCVLLVDDDRSVLTMYGDYLQTQGFKVFMETSGEDALARLLEDQSVIDILVTDIMMAKFNGWELLDYVRKELGLDEVALPVIVMSAVDGVDLQMDYIRHRANDWVVKPIQPLAKLADKVRALLGLARRQKGDADDGRS